MDICGIINERDDMYTTSSCAGRCFMYRGSGIKSTTDFKRFRISHEKIADPDRFFDLAKIESDPSGGGDDIRSVGQYDYKTNKTTSFDNDTNEEKEKKTPPENIILTSRPTSSKSSSDETIWVSLLWCSRPSCRSVVYNPVLGLYCPARTFSSGITIVRAFGLTAFTW